MAKKVNPTAKAEETKKEVNPTAKAEETKKEITSINWDAYDNEIEVITNKCKSFEAGIEYTVTKEIAKILVGKGNVSLKQWRE